MSSTVLDIILILIVVITMIRSMRKGFLRCVLSLICVVIAVVGASSLCKPAAEWCYDNIVDTIVVNSIQTKLDNFLDGDSGVNAVKAAVESVPSVVIDQLDVLALDLDSLITGITELDLSAEETAVQISKQIVRPGALIVLRLICYLILFFIIRFVCGIVTNIIHRLLNITPLKKVNKFLGAILGLAKGAATVVAVVLLLNLYVSIVKDNNVLNQAIEFSYICDIINDVDLISLISGNA